MPFAKPCFNDATIREVVDSLESGWITTGPKVKKFEEMLKNYVQSPAVSVVSSATAGLQLALMLCDLQPGDEVITTSFTFVATLNTIVQAGGKPILVDVDRGTYNINMDQVASKITSRTRAIVPVHFAGAPVDLDRLYGLAHQHNIRVIEDAAHAIGTQYKGRKIGSFGDIQVLSFHPNKNITTGEGGCIVLHNSDELPRINALKFHGIDRESWNRFAKNGSQMYDVIAPGYKYNMMDIQAAMGIHQLPELDRFIVERTRIVEKYRLALKDWPEIILPQAPSYDHLHAWDLFAITINPEGTNITRNQFIEGMKELNIGIGLHWQAPHLFTYYQEMGYKKGDFPNAEHIADHVASLPLFPQMTDEEHDRVIAAMKKVLNKR